MTAAWHPSLLVAGLCTALLVLAQPAQAQRDKDKPLDPKHDVSQIGDRGVGKAFNLYTLKQDQIMGKRAADEFEKQVRILNDPVTAEYVNRIAQNLARNSDAKVPITTKVIDSIQINAMALPGGYTFVNAGLILFARDETELAGVMAHEIAHVAARHGTRSVSRGQVGSLLGNLAVALSGEKARATHSALSIALPMTFLKFSRTFEKEADFLGVQYLYATGYDPLGMVQVFERMAALSKRRKGAVSALFSSHPMSTKRARLVQETIDEILPPKAAYSVTGTEFQQIKARLANHYR